MPELPEVETVKNGIKDRLTGRYLQDTQINIDRLRILVPKDRFRELIGSQVIKIYRRAKYLILDFNNDRSLIFHLGMSGQILLTQDKYHLKKHDHLLFYFDLQYILIFNDPRKFGLVDVQKTDEVSQISYIKNLGLEPFDDEFNASYLVTKLQNKIIPIKLAIMDNKIVVGIGNIYASEILFMAGISPLRAAKFISMEEAGRVIICAKIVLQDAINAGGSTLKDYVQADGKTGYFQHNFAVYDRKNKPCIKCKSLISKLVLGGRATYYCGDCQK